MPLPSLVNDTEDATLLKDGKSGGWRSRFRNALPVAIALIVGIGLSISAWRAVWNWDERLAQAELNAVGEDHALALQNGFNEYLGKVAAVRALFDASDDPVSRNEFTAFATRLLHDQASILRINWVPRIRQSEKEKHEAAAAREGMPWYRIKQLLVDRVPDPMSASYDHFPIFYSTTPPNPGVYGLDVATQPTRRRALERARDGDMITTSANVTIRGANNSSSIGFVAVMPVYLRGQPHVTIEDRRHNIAGFVAGVFQFPAMTEAILQTTTVARGADIYLFPGLTASEEPVYVHPSRLRKAPLKSKNLNEILQNLHWSGELKVGDTSWTIVATAVPDGPLAARHDRAWIVLGSGLLITLGLVAYICVSGRYARRLLIANKRVSELAQMDELTGLANRRAFFERLTAVFVAAQRGAPPFAVLYFDLDHFKDVNDTLGHPIGDRLLRRVTERLQGVLRNDDLLARFGGDEFAVLQGNAGDAATAGALAAKLSEVLAAPYKIGGNEVRISASIGIAFYSSDVSGPEAMMIQADLALYRAKEDGRNCVRFHSIDLDEQVRERVTIADDLRLAIERGELMLHYQPQVEVSSGRIVGLEALIRWRHPTRGMISPALFIPIAERTGNIVALGTWAFDEACRQLKIWQDLGIAPDVLAVNFSALQFKKPYNLDCCYVAASLAKWGVSPMRIEIELTETALMEVTQQHNGMLERMREMGLKIAIDDFGTGYSSLNYLTLYPFNRLKIAQELMFRVAIDSRSATVVRAAIGLANDLGIEVIAEGVETAEQAKFLTSAGCELAQGYYFSRPVEAERTTALLRKGRIDLIPQRESEDIIAA
ncbi:MAG TPA: EAL domain-containing protein [Xanthobacteraceae bacterium]|jgi:diguanylate cyclase (GGDEF)-like protein|nr:EAL domain-containing protein [Xanthobacteraceae bacterium]